MTTGDFGSLSGARWRPYPITVPARRTLHVRVNDVDEPDPIPPGRRFRGSPRSRRIAAEPHIFFQTPHYEGYPAVLVRLSQIDSGELREVLIESHGVAWLPRGWCESSTRSRFLHRIVRHRPKDRARTEAGRTARESAVGSVT
jgi:hypothetical protein